ncbi:hypothetical protein JS528_08240 [Bifidobacterium sp. MA2]|uniref:Ethanolamine utilization protein EutL n=1 Tax=Bifidobacterium santillanense TaxID=2809028 RepID=A0ABS5UR34_9BIFI|nr:hypothetical protein [Bifidobacterium santillanense]MBT1173335.1 hypothetical protein [Bifidobacterium santillanense]
MSNDIDPRRDQRNPQQQNDEQTAIVRPTGATPDETGATVPITAVNRSEAQDAATMPITASATTGDARAEQYDAQHAYGATHDATRDAAAGAAGTPGAFPPQYVNAAAASEIPTGTDTPAGQTGANSANAGQPNDPQGGQTYQQPFRDSPFMGGGTGNGQFAPGATGFAGEPGGQGVAVASKLSGKVIAIVAGVTLVCGLLGGVAGGFTVNALSGGSESGGSSQQMGGQMGGGMGGGQMGQMPGGSNGNGGGSSNSDGSSSDSSGSSSNGSSSSGSSQNGQMGQPPSGGQGGQSNGNGGSSSSGSGSSDSSSSSGSSTSSSTDGAADSGDSISA